MQIEDNQVGLFLANPTIRVAGGGTTDRLMAFLGQDLTEEVTSGCIIFNDGNHRARACGLRTHSTPHGKQLETPQSRGNGEMSEASPLESSSHLIVYERGAKG
jgi:hypothetical protein